MWTPKSRTRRADIRKNRPEDSRFCMSRIYLPEGARGPLWVAIIFFVCATSILMWRQEVITYRPGQWIPNDIVARVPFSYADADVRSQLQNVARRHEPLVYRVPEEDPWADLQKELSGLPDLAANGGSELPDKIKSILDNSTVSLMGGYARGTDREDYLSRVEKYITALRGLRITDQGQEHSLIILSSADWMQNLKSKRQIRLGSEVIDPYRAFPAKDDEKGRQLRSIFMSLASRQFILALQPKIVDITLAELKPNAVFDPNASAEAQDAAAYAIAPESAIQRINRNEVFIEKTKNIFDQQDWQKLKAENTQFLKSLKGSNWKSRLGTALLAFIVTVVLVAYVKAYQPRVSKNVGRATGIATLMLAMLLLAQMTGLGSGPLYLLGVAPTLLVAMILTIAYEHRFAIGLASMHGMLATVALQQGVMFFIIIWVGVLTASFLLGDIRSRSKIIEVGGAMALTMMVATLAAGFMGIDPSRFVVENALYAGAAGLASGFIVLGILPFIEKAFRITTSMTLLELADASHPLLRRLQIEAAGTYNHSLQVATLAEAAAESIKGNSLLCRVGSYYHDIGKIHKAEYFAENQGSGGSRHINLTPSVSLLIIIGHVKDGVEMANEYNLPKSLVPFIQQHHGTTLVEYFYHQACKRDAQHPDAPGVSEMQYRYPGPKPRSKEVAIVMICDAAESACRAMPEPTASRVEALVHDLLMRRLLDGQFDECDLTMRDLEQIERSIMKSLLAIYHGRIQYPSTAQITAAPSAAGAIRSA
jgi:putative nucleotidyltransferase with HDIG domain